MCWWQARVIAFQTPKRGLEAILACETTERVCPIAVALRRTQRLDQLTQKHTEE